MTINAFPEQRRGLWRVKTAPYLRKERWPDADFGDRWRDLKARLRGDGRDQYDDVWQRQTVTIATCFPVIDESSGEWAVKTGARDVDAIVCGPFAINADPFYPTDVIVTHVPTGTSLFCTTSIQRAKRFCNGVRDLCDWATLTLESAQDVPAEIKAAIREARTRAAAP